MANRKKEESRWYVLRCAGRQELKLRYELERVKAECFVPLQKRYRLKKERRVIELVPAVSGIVFGKLTLSLLAGLREKSPIRFFTWTDRATGKPMVVPGAAMSNFIGVAGTCDEQLVYLPSEPVNWDKGQLVRITGGPFRGYEGRFVRVKGDRRLVVEIPGVMAVATGFIHPSLVEAIPEETDGPAEE